MALAGPLARAARGAPGRRLALGESLPPFSAGERACRRLMRPPRDDPRSHVPSDNSTFLRGVVPTDHTGTASFPAFLALASPTLARD